MTRYMHLNPVKIAACRKLDRRERLRRLNAYPWSSYPGYADVRKIHEFVSYEVLKEYGRNEAESAAAVQGLYRGVLAGGRRANPGGDGGQPAIGDTRFVEQTERRVEARRSGRTQDKDLDFPRWTVPPDEIDAAVASALWHRREAVAGTWSKRRRGESSSRGTGLPARRDDRTRHRAHYGEISSAAVSTTHRKVRQGKYPIAPVVNSLLIQLTAKRRRK